MMSRLIYVLLNGIFFAALQSGYFFQLEINMTAAYPSFLTVTLAWLLGSAVGLRLGGYLRPSIWIGLSLFAYYLTQNLVHQFPYQLELLPLCGGLIALSGIQAGTFFQVNRNILRTAGRLFFWENNGFLLGWIIGFAGFGWGGVLFLGLMPGLLGLGLVWYEKIVIKGSSDFHGFSLKLIL